MNDNISQERKNSDNITTLLFLDLETTGLDYKQEKIIEIGACLVEYNSVNNKYKIISTFNELINIKEQLSSKIIELTNISQDLIDSADGIIKVQEKWASWAESHIDLNKNIFIVGHSVGDFDLKYIKNEGYYLPSKYKIIDTNLFAKTILPFADAQNLEYLSKLYDIKFDLDIEGISHHRALFDCYTNYKVFIKMFDAFCNVSLSNNLRSNIIKSILHSFPTKYYELSWSNKNITENKINQPIKTNKNYVYTDSYFQSQYNFLNYLKLILNRNDLSLNEFFDYFWSLEIQNISIRNAFIQVQYIYEFLKFNKSDFIINRLSVNPYIQSKLYLVLYSFFKKQDVEDDYRIIFDNIINDYDYICSDVVNIKLISDCIQISDLIHPSNIYQEFYNQFVIFKNEFEKCASFGSYYLDKEMSNMDLKSSLFEQNYNKFIGFLKSLSFDKSENVILEGVRLILEKEISKINPKNSSIIKINGNFIKLFYKNNIDIIQYYSSKSNVYSYFSIEELEEFNNTLGINLTNIKHIKGFDNFYDNVTILDPKYSINQCLEKIENQEKERGVVLLNSYKIYKELESELKNVQNSNKLISKSMFVVGSMGSFTKGSAKLKNKSIDVLFTQKKQFKPLLNFVDESYFIYFIGNTSLNYSHLWTYKKGFNNIRKLLLKSEILSAKDESNKTLDS